MQSISQTFKGVIPPTRISQTNGDGRINTIIDWSAIASGHIPAGAIEPQIELVLEYLTCTHFLPGLYGIPADSYPKFSAADGDAVRGAKLTEFKRKFPPDKNYAVQFLLWNWWNGAWQLQHFDRDHLQSHGIEGRINLIKPFLVTAGDTVFGDVLHKLGLSIEPRYLRNGEYLEISGGYSGSISYLYKEPEVLLTEGQAGGISVSTTPTQVLNSSPKRAALYIGNDGTKRLYWRFTNNPLLLTPRSSPYLDPGESLTYEHGQLFYSGKNNHQLLKNQINSICKFPFYSISVTGSTNVVFQELIYP